MSDPQSLDGHVDAIVDDLLARRQVEAATAEFKRLGPAATARLCQHLSVADFARRSIALFALQHCWTAAAAEPVAALLADDDEELRKMAAIALVRGQGFEALARASQPLLKDPRPGVAGFALQNLEGEAPDLGRTRRLLPQRRFWPHLRKHLLRYRTAALTPDTLGMLAEGEAEESRAAMAALVHQNAADTQIRERLAARLADSDPASREFAAEYLSWHGSAAEQPALAAALAGEDDAFAAAAMRHAESAISRRRRGRLEPAKRARELADLAQTEPFEPHWAYRGQSADESFITGRKARFERLAKLFAMPGRGPREERHDGPNTVPPGNQLMAPLRDFFDADRRTFGKQQDHTAIEGFGGMVHVADDVAWNQGQATVVAIGDGLVRYVGCSATWGYMVIIEHRLQGARGPDEIFCSLYAHLGPFVALGTGQAVQKGGKVGVIGRTYTWENGGYVAHLHFAIHDGPYAQVWLPGALIDIRFEGLNYLGRVVRSERQQTEASIATAAGRQTVTTPTNWVRGYMGEAAWQAGHHGWRQPQDFIRRRSGS
ncbi:MAG TPA: M23 family metallopeptidase [Alphaproteobacteria bacterium]|jgi:hypothetical protein|nr:M23 family metallopeptidase [Alphaproteobacteria bacterium]MDP6272076.1 M23 family metallopeptidase [Alphaproteobacteria bacterium]MDP7429095.1 M23 family metallopeptidase [Alphaproteobacteria bacterium]HJM48340.1 M23 family metallopeptidase [Alphaproteobacteria bacterium]